jgi:S1-C subfamily serine protease
MGGPKHLWSGDWQQESAAAARRAAPRPVAAEPEAPAPRPEPARRRPVRIAWRPVVRFGLPAVLAAVVIAAGAYAVINLFAASGSAASTSTGTLVGPSATVDWLGMQIETVPPGAAVIDTVTPGSPGDHAGLNPGAVILAVNNRPIHGAGDIAAAIRGLPAGDQVPIQISYGSSLYQTEATLAAPPSHP